MFRVFLSLLFLFSMSGLVVACGGDDDDDDSGNPFATPGGDSGDDSDGDDSGDDDSDDDGSDGDDDGDSGSSGDVDLDDIPDGGYTGGTLHVVISGDVDQEFDLDGGGFSTGGFANFGFAGADAIGVNLAFGTDDEPGAITIVTEEVVTGGVWGEDCDVSLEDTGNGVRGEFSCDDLDGFDPEDNDIFDNLDVRGEFSLTRE